MNNPKVIIIGNGIAGLMSAIKLAGGGAKVAIISPNGMRRSYSPFYEEGVNVALRSDCKQFSVEDHIETTVSNGLFLAHLKPIVNMCEKAGDIILMLERMGLAFARTIDGRFDFRFCEENQNVSQVYAEGSTGLRILYVLDSQIRKYESRGLVKNFEFWRFNSIVKDESGHAVGVTATNLLTMDVRFFPADAVIVSAGGYGGAFDWRSSRSDFASAALSAVYGQGAGLANCDLVEFATKDSGERYVKYSLGGLHVDKNGMTLIPGVFAAGESSYLYHGAHSLSGNILLSEIFDSMVVVGAALDYAKNFSSGENSVSERIPEDEVKRQTEINKKYLVNDGNENVFKLRIELAEVLNAVTGEMCKNKEEGLSKINELGERILECRVLDSAKWANNELVAKRNLYDTLRIATAIVICAADRKDHPAKIIKLECAQDLPRVSCEEIDNK